MAKAKISYKRIDSAITKIKNIKTDDSYIFSLKEKQEFNELLNYIDLLEIIIKEASDSLSLLNKHTAD